MKILIVDDETDIQSLFLQKFRKELKNGLFSFEFALSGAEALEYMQTLKPFDIVLLLSDINMPGMNGVELLKEAKNRFPSLKVIMISANADASNIETSYNLGASGFFSKPVDFRLLRETLVN